MLYNYNEVQNKFKDDYNIKKAIEAKLIFKLDKGLYSDRPNVHYLDIVTKKYPGAIISGLSAYYYHNLTDVIPDKIELCTGINATRVNDKKIKQIRMKDELYNLGKTQIKYENVTINIYDRERLLIDLARNKNKIGYDVYKEIIANYRIIADTLNMRKIEHYLSYFVNHDNLLKILQDEVF